MKNYRIGDREFRPWGYFKVLDAGTLPDGRNFCEKLLVIAPNKILSLQSHDLREEVWTVQAGTLTALRNWRRHILSAGATITIPKRSIHTIANVGKEPLVLLERQYGTCLEDDIIRYADSYGRALSASGPAWLFLTQRLYKSMAKEIMREALKKTA